MTTAAATRKRRAGGQTRMWPMLSGHAEPDVPLSERAAVASTSFTVVAILCAWFLAQVFFLGALEQNRAQGRLYDEFRTQLAAATAPTGGLVKPGAPVAIMRIPHLSYEHVIVEGTTSGTMLTGPGHRRDTVLPGQAGVSLVYGRARSFGATFADIATKALGQDLTFVTGQGQSVYRIADVRRAGDPMPPPLAAGGSRITFVTAEGGGRLSALAPRHVIYIDAVIRSKAFQAPGGRLNAISAAELPMSGDKTVLPILSLSLGALVLATVGVIVARRRFGLVLTWVIATPVMLALAWNVTDLAMYLLPNLL